MNRNTIRSVDLFCGCGGLALGFELHDGRLDYQTVLAADNDEASVDTFNRNLTAGDREFPTARLCDLSWFNHRSEVLLYYLSHYALWLPDQELQQELAELGFRDFLADLRSLDAECSRRLEVLADSSGYTDAWDDVGGRVETLALCRSVLGRLGLSSFSSPALARSKLAWSDESRRYDVGEGEVPEGVHGSLEQSASQIWDEQLARIENAAESDGRGQHSGVADRMARLADFLRGSNGRGLKELWGWWKPRRDSLRASFCLEHASELEAMYRAGREVQLVLGGPPCKGWSRIGRAVIEDLRDQGVHAWACKQYGDERNALLHKYVLFLDALQPSAFLFENVAHFNSSLSTPSGEIEASEILEQSINELATRDLRFHVHSEIVRARRHGIPQDRDRFIMVGIRGDETAETWLEEFFRKVPTYGEEVPLKTALLGLEDPAVFDPYDRTNGTDHRSRAYTFIDRRLPEAQLEYLTWVRQPEPGQRSAPTSVDGHIVRRGRDDDRSLYEYMAPGTRWMDYKFEEIPTQQRLKAMLEQVRDHVEANGDSSQLPRVEELDRILDRLDSGFVLRLLLEALDPPGEKEEGHHLLKDGYMAKGPDNHGDWLERLSPDRPSKTIVAHIGKDTYGYIHPYQARALSLREAARIQSFPDFFELGGGGVVDTYSMVGNAVPPLLANHFAEAFEELHGLHGVFDISRAAWVEAEERDGQLTMLS